MNVFIPKKVICSFLIGLAVCLLALAERNLTYEPYGIGIVVAVVIWCVCKGISAAEGID